MVMVAELLTIYRASNEEIAADYATAWLGYLIQENGTASEDCITIGCLSLEVVNSQVRRAMYGKQSSSYRNWIKYLEISSLLQSLYISWMSHL